MIMNTVAIDNTISIIWFLGCNNSDVNCDFGEYVGLCVGKDVGSDVGTLDIVGKDVGCDVGVYDWNECECEISSYIFSAI